MNSTYSTNVRLGNWYEDICLEEDEIYTFLKLRAKNQLVIQKTRSLFRNFFREVELDPPADYIRIGAVVQLIAARMQLCKAGSGSSRPALSIIINDKMIHKSQNISDKCDITVAPTTKPCSRNCFVLKSGDAIDRTNEILKYGQDFTLECIYAEENPTVLYSCQKSPNLTTVIQPTYDCFHRGETNLPVGLCLKRHIGPGQLLPLAYARWRCTHENPSLRFEMEGKSVESNTPLLITHSATNQNLAAENLQVATIFGQECLVSVHNYIDVDKPSEWKNIWMIAIGNR